MGQDSTEIIMYGASWCPDCHRSRAYLDSHNIPYEWVNIEESAEAADLVTEINGGYRSIPTIVFPDGSHLTEPSNQVLEAKLASLMADK